MTDIFVLDEEPHALEVPAAANVPVSANTAAEWQALVARMTAQEGKAIGDLAGVVLTNPQTGQVLVFDATGTLVNGQVTGAIDSVLNNGGLVLTNVRQLNYTEGIEAVLSETNPDRAVMRLIWGGSGTSKSAARSDHAHSIRADVPLPIAASGSFSSGTRTLTSGTITGLDPARTYIVKGALLLDLRGEGTGAGYSLPRITIHGNGRDRFDRVRTVAGVDQPWSTSHPGVSVTGVSSVAVSATLAYSEGDPVYVGAGELTIDIESNR